MSENRKKQQLSTSKIPTSAAPSPKNLPPQPPKSPEILYEEKLKSSGLTLKDAEYLGFKLLTPQETQAFNSSAPPNPSILIKYHYMDGSPDLWESGDRIRILGEPRGFHGSAKKPPRFFQKPGTMPQVYIPVHPAVPSWIKTNYDTNIPLIITEGELKAACAVKHGLPCVAIGGVYSWKSAAHECALLPELKKILNLHKRKVYLIFDSDSATNPAVQKALVEFAETLIRSRAARVYIVDLYEVEGKPKTGIDDFIVALGIEAFNRHIAHEARAFPAYQDLESFNDRFLVVEESMFVLNRKTTKLATYKEAKEWYGEDKMSVLDYRKKPKFVKTINEWLDWRGKTTVESLCFKPNRKPLSIVDNQFNIWGGLPTTPKAGPIDAWHEYLNHLIPVPDDRLWLELWIGWRFQNLHIKPLTAVCIFSPTQGTGKSLLSKVLTSILGNAYAQSIDPEEFLSPHNTYIVRKLLIFVEEIYAFNRPGYTSKLKTYITQNRVNINPKHKDLYTVDDLAGFIFTSNHMDPIYLDEDDRRYYLIEGTKILYSVKNAQPLTRLIKTAKGRGALLHYFQTMDLQGFDARERTPTTPTKRAAITRNKHDIHKWLDEIQEGDMMEFCDGCVLRTSHELLPIYRLQTGDETPYSAHTVGRQLGKAKFEQVNQGVNVSFRHKPSDSPSRAYWLMDKTQKHFLDMSAKELGEYLNKHYKPFNKG